MLANCTGVGEKHGKNNRVFGAVSGLEVGCGDILPFFHWSGSEVEHGIFLCTISAIMHSEEGKGRWKYPLSHYFHNGVTLHMLLSRRAYRKRAEKGWCSLSWKNRSVLDVVWSKPRRCWERRVGASFITLVIQKAGYLIWRHCCKYPLDGVQHTCDSILQTRFLSGRNTLWTIHVQRNNARCHEGRNSRGHYTW